LEEYGSPESRDRYDDLIAEWLVTNGDTVRYTLTVDDLCILYMEHADGYYRSDGMPTTEVGSIRQAFRPLIQSCGATRAREFGPLKLKRVRSKMIDAGHVRTSINRRVERIRQMFKWATSEELLPVSVHTTLMTVSGQRPRDSESIPLMVHFDAKTVFVVAIAALLIIRAVYAIPTIGVPVAKRYLHFMQDVPLFIAKLSLVVPINWAVSPVLEFADYPSRSIMLIAGTILYAVGLWIFYRSHADLGTNWSQTLEIKEGHQLVTDGVYNRVRHPMYLASLVFAMGQALVVPNYLAGPSFLIGVMLLIAFRVRHEERMMLDEFGDQYASYCERSYRLIPRIW
jgi:protein-S-isoprenylcysteine O-methyltransferase Ste14